MLVHIVSNLYNIDNGVCSRHSATPENPPTIQFVPCPTISVVVLLAACLNNSLCFHGK